MRAWLQVGLLALLGGVMTVSCLGQSVAEAARQEQQRQSKPQPGRRVYTNDDFPARLPEAAPAASPQEKNSLPAAAQKSKKPSAEEVSAAVLAQKQKIRGLDARLASLQRQLDEWSNANLGSWCPTGNYYYNPYQAWCESPQVLVLERDRVQAQRDDAQRDLEQMQEQARRMGYRSTVYDPD